MKMFFHRRWFYSYNKSEVFLHWMFVIAIRTIHMEYLHILSETETFDDL